MGIARKVGLAGLGIVLFVLLLSANAVVALDQTALDAEFTKETAEEADLYETFADEMTSQLEGAGPTNAEQLPIDRSPQEILQAVDLEGYFRSQGEENIDATYAYLHGETEEPQIEFETEPLKEEMVAEVETDVEDTNLSDLDAMFGTETEGMPSGAELERMAESREAFEDQRQEFRAERKAEIQAETERELSDEELEAALDDRMDDIRQGMLEGVDAGLEGELEGPQAELEEPVRSLQIAYIDAVTGETTYEEYAQTVETARGDIRDAFVDIFEAQLDEQLPESVDVTEQLGEEEMETVETAQTAVSVMNTLAIVLPILALLVAGGIGWLAAQSTAAIEIGAVSLLVGAIGVVGSFVGTEQFQQLFDPANAPPGVGEFVTTFVTGILGVLTWQSAFLAVLGVIAVAVGLAIRWEYL
jgi:hypothetical protein